MEIKMYSTSVSALLALLAGLANSFFWDIVVGEQKRLAFYYKRTQTHTEDIPSANHIKSVAYDPVHYRVFFADYHKNTTKTSHKVYISSFDLSTRKIQPLATINLSKIPYVRIVYDPVTQLLFWKDKSTIYSYSLNPASSNEAIDGNPLVKLHHYCQDIAVNSCRGYIYWITNDMLERALFNGSQREILIDNKVQYRGSLAMDQQTQKMYWTELIKIGSSSHASNNKFQLSIKSADFNGKNINILQIFVRKHVLRFSLAVTKDFIYWKNYDQVGIWQLPKNASQDETGKAFSMSGTFCWYCRILAANYTMKEMTQKCETLQYMIPRYRSRHNIDDRPVSTVSICHNYCLQGDCSIVMGQPKCRCKAGYSGVRCEVNACHKYCLNDGVCSLNEEYKPVCQCTEFYDGLRCDVHTFLVKYIHAVSLLRGMLKDVTAVTLGPGVNLTCDSTIN